MFVVWKRNLKSILVSISLRDGYLTLHYRTAMSLGNCGTSAASTTVVTLLTLARVGEAEGYCNHSVCLFVPKIPANLLTLELRKNYQQFSNNT